MYYIADWKCPSHSTIVILNCHNFLAKRVWYGMVWYGNCLFDIYKRHNENNYE